MTKFYYLKLSKFKKIRYIKHVQKDSDYIVFLHGFMSDLEGKKPKFFLNFAKKNKLGFIALEYSGHGKSTGKFTKGNISKWTRETYLLLKKTVKFTKKMKAETIKKGIYHLKHGNYTYPITLQLLRDGRKNKIFNKKIRSKIKVTMVHGQKDEVVPVSYSKKILKIFTNAKKKLVIVKNGDHSLSSNRGLKILKKEIKLITS